VKTEIFLKVYSSFYLNKIAIRTIKSYLWKGKA